MPGFGLIRRGASSIGSILLFLHHEVSALLWFCTSLVASITRSVVSSLLFCCSASARHQPFQSALLPTLIMVGTRRFPRPLTPVPDSSGDSPAAPPAVDLADLADLAENTAPGPPRLGSVICPSDEQAEEDGLLSPVHLSRGRVRIRSGSSPGSPAPPASKKSKGKQKAFPPDFHGFSPNTPLVGPSAPPSPAPSGLTLRREGQQKSKLDTTERVILATSDVQNHNRADTSWCRNKRILPMEEAPRRISPKPGIPRSRASGRNAHNFGL
ncbi:hypothetical protein DEU56DRAFT_944937 [Suillus clintonianus]|uniref:uncharacterized protein n=1 Tax=Suillus clintonianus TaxID=1904413 RepID=UPI001B87D834|nr:uncharacterized protein DEU56DRAFT_944937 [Suillus clintonianus]KAG2138505.1 hypothetical protein DEU56DRAFT_944937 [Suillus clintonianus]